MPCDTKLSAGQTLAARMEEVGRALRALQARLAAGTTKVTIAANGAVVFDGWTVADRKGVNDACAYRTLAAQGSWELRKAVLAAETRQSRKVNPQAIAAGLHTHDGRTWGTH